MRHMIVLVTLLLAVVCWSGVSGQDTKKGRRPKTDARTGTEITAEGTGRTADEALKDAFRNAVRQVVGAVVDAETLIKNDEIIKNKVLTYSDGFVKTYDEISKNREEGLFRVKIKATVERRSVITKLREAKVAVKEVGGKGIWANIITDNEAARNARKLVSNALEGFPLNVLAAEVVGEPQVVEKKKSRVTLKITIRFKVKQKAYDTFAEKLRRVLEAIKKEKHELSLVLKPDAGGYYWELRPATQQGDNLVGPNGQFYKNQGKRSILILNTQTTRGLDRTEWDCYILDNTCLMPLKGCSKDLTVRLSFLGDDGKLIARDSFPAEAKPAENRELQKVLPIYQENEADNIFWLSPFFLTSTGITGHHRNAGYRLMTTHRTITLSLREVKAIQSVKCEWSE